MIRPAAFCANSQTRQSNAFQSKRADFQDAQHLAREEFDRLTQALAHAGVRIHKFEDAIDPPKPDAIFPNNWVTFHADGSVVLYPMLAANRRMERRHDILDALIGDNDFEVSRRVDLTDLELNGHYLEGTGSLVLDRAKKIAYACLSPRTDESALAIFSKSMNYELCTFRASDQQGTPVYHTNVLMSIGRKFAVICPESIDAADKPRILHRLRQTREFVLEISPEQMHSFAGNILELATTNQRSIIALSTRAYDSLTPSQRDTLSSCTDSFVHVPIPTIECLGGGSVRCMIAEIFLPRRRANSA